MKQLTAKVVQDAKNVVFYPSEKRICYPEDEGSHRLKRRAPRLPRPYPPQPSKDARQSDTETE